MSARVPAQHQESGQEGLAVNMKVSRYNHLFAYSAGLRLAFNALTGSVLCVQGKDGDLIQGVLEGKRRIGGSAAWRDRLGQLGFLVEPDINEVNVLREMFRIAREREDGSAAITILPTLACNFACSYCFEQHCGGPMSPEIQDALVEFVRTRVLRHGASLSVEWFGGEPLLALPVIEHLTERLESACREEGAGTPRGSMVTNGYLLTPQNVSRLLAAHISSAQVTLDGPAEVHDRRRPLSGGGGSFRRIIENLKQLPESFHVCVRINVNGGNRGHILELLKLLFAEGVIPRATAYVSRVESFGEKCQSSEGGLLTAEDFAAYRRDLAEECSRAGIPRMWNDHPRVLALGVCVVDQRKSFVVEPDGRLLKCWAEAGNQCGEAVAHLRCRESWDRIATSSLERRNPFDDGECCACGILPICMGGCPRLREDTRRRGDKRCPPLRYSLAEAVRAFYFSLHPEEAAVAGSQVASADQAQGRRE